MFCLGMLSGPGWGPQLFVDTSHHFQLADYCLCCKEQVSALQFPLCGGGSLTKVSCARRKCRSIQFYFRNQLRVGLTLSLVFLAKLLQTPWLLDHTYLLPANTSTEGIDLTQAANMPLTCKILSMSDQILMTTLIFYLAGLSIYMFCRFPNHPIFAASEKTVKVNSLLLTPHYFLQLD